MSLKQISGFTMVETIAVLVVMGILTTVSVSTFMTMGDSEYAERMLLKTNLRYARQRALDSTNQWGVAFSAGSYSLTKDSATGEDFPSIEEGTHDSGVSFAHSGNIAFEAQTGVLVSPSTQTVTFDGGTTVTVYPTGCIQ